MATRLDQVSRMARAAQRARLDARATGPVEAPLGPEIGGAASVPARALAQASAMWLGLTFLSCYMILPGLAGLLGAGASDSLGFWPRYPAFLLVSALAVTVITEGRPEVRLSSARRDPVLAAALGSFVTWAVLQPLLTPFSAMTAVGLASLVAIRLLESVLIGTLLASLTDRPGRALTLAAAFRLAVWALSWSLLGVTL